MQLELHKPKYPDFLYKHIHIYIYICIYICISLWGGGSIHTHVCIYIYMYIHIYIYIWVRSPMDRHLWARRPIAHAWPPMQGRQCVVISGFRVVSCSFSRFSAPRACLDQARNSVGCMLVAMWVAEGLSQQSYSQVVSRESEDALKPSTCLCSTAEKWPNRQRTATESAKESIFVLLSLLRSLDWQYQC